MAETTKIVIFPKVRLSELKQDVAFKKQNLVISQQELRSTVREKTKPFIFLKEHPRLIVGTLFTLLSGSKISLKILSSFFAQNKSRMVWKVVKAGWFWKMAKMGSQWLIKNKGKNLEKIGLQLLKTLLKKS